MDRPYQLVLDTNVLIAGLRSNQGASFKLLTLLNNSRWQINLSTGLALEYEAVLKRNQNELGLSSKSIDTIVGSLCAIANHHQIYYLWRPTSTDPDDDFLIDLAINAQADFIITYNKKDLRNVTQFGIQLLTPKEFLQAAGVIP